MECPNCDHINACAHCGYSGYKEPVHCELCYRLREASELRESSVPQCGRDTTCAAWAKSHKHHGLMVLDGFEGCPKILVCQFCDPMKDSGECYECGDEKGVLTHFKVRGEADYRFICANCFSKSS